ncbi:hypothetical protein M513_12030 [Trichuris suis]|uniref:Uncharacterized protein n=1 Tax=Trichuris suis TaxID=68888 RepID=A0A085LQ74_9BILA|nr:hypothetical protein M513_12030 [Trichuris suis]
MFCLSTWARSPVYSQLMGSIKNESSFAVQVGSMAHWCTAVLKVGFFWEQEFGFMCEDVRLSTTSRRNAFCSAARGGVLRWIDLWQFFGRPQRVLRLPNSPMLIASRLLVLSWANISAAERHLSTAARWSTCASDRYTVCTRWPVGRANPLSVNVGPFACVQPTYGQYKERVLVCSASGIDGALVYSSVESRVLLGTGVWFHV